MSDAKAKIIQRCFKKHMKTSATYVIASKYLKQGPTAERVKSLSFEALVTFLREKEVISLTKDVLQRIHTKAVFLHGSPEGMVPPERVNVRVFLAGYMVAYRPANVFEDMGKLEQELLQAAVPLLESFESILEAIVSSKKKSFSDISPELSANFTTMLYNYLKCFKAWKVPDEAKLTSRIKHALVALYQAQAMLPPTESEEDTKLREEFVRQINRLEEKLVTIAGQATLDAVKATPIVVETVHRQSLGADRLTNEHLAHELLINPLFQLTDDGCGHAMHRCIQESFHKAFWESICDDLRLQPNPCFVRVFRVLGEIKDGIHDLAGSREGHRLNEIIDIDFIKDRVQTGAYDWECCKQLVGGTVGIIDRVQAPRRDAETRLMWAEISQAMDEAQGQPDLQPKVFCKALEFLLNRVNAMRVDAANARLRLIAPVIIEHGDEYEKSKFQARLNNGTVTLHKTAKWIEEAVHKYIQEDNAALTQLTTGQSSAFEKVFRKAMLSLVFDEQPVQESKCPETLAMDLLRLKMIQDELKYLATAATVAVILAGVANAEDVSGIVLQSSSKDEIIEKASASIATMDMPPAKRVSVERCLAHSDEVFKIMKNRVHAAFTSAVVTKKVQNEKALTTAKMLIPRIEKVAAVLARVNEISVRVHGKRYNDLIALEVAKLGHGQATVSRL